MARTKRGTTREHFLADEATPVPEGPAKLAFLDSKGLPVSVSLTTPRTEIGRATSCQVRLADGRVSRVHALIEIMSSQHLITDNGSANGTSLNGHRLPKGTALVLRDGDEITVGATRLVFGHGDDLAHALENELEGSVESSYRLEELGRRLEDGPEITAELIRAFSGVSRAEGLVRALAVVATRLDVQAAAIFGPHGVQGIELAAAHPAPEKVTSLESVARPIMASERGRIVRESQNVGERASATTKAMGLTSAAAVPLTQGDRPIGVLAVERRHGLCLDRGDLARLALIGGRLAATLALHDTNETDTRTGVDG